ncbi:MAG: crossover junction endodeoxyribonuclease RuvC [Muribaculaceae bacterium]|nr:crossover junction endodeoxyribonuclease RuvC [Muribaculaceae bacterium]
MDTREFERVIMGIDPGTNVMGYGVLGIKGRKLTPVILGAIELNKVGDHYLRLARIYERVTGIIDQYLPDELAIEAPFYGKNVQSMLKLGRAQGVAMAAALARQIPIAEYAPLKVKQVVTGNGGASKEQVANMLCYILKMERDKLPSLLDATDAMAVALAHYYESGKPTAGTGAKNWAQFIKQHPDRIVGKTINNKQ